MATTPNLPQPQSYQETLGAMLNQFAAATGIPSVSVGSASLSLFQTMALAVSRASGDVFQTILNSSLQYATGSSLQAMAAEFNIELTPSQVSTGYVTVTDTSFTMVSTSVYPGAAATNAGSVIIYASSNTGFPSSGSVYLGRGTNNSEGPIGYSSIVAVGNYFQFNLTSPTTKFHNLNESIILSQGGVRTVPINTVVTAPSNGLVAAQQYTVTQQGIILDGATSVSNIPVTAQLPGSAGDVPAAAISQFASPPFSGATVSNPVPTSGGTDPETDDEIRTAIQNFFSSIGLGTPTAIKNSLIGVSSTTEAGTITSDSLVNNLDGSSTVYISTGGGRPYEAKTAGVAIEHIIDSAIGGEQFFQLATGGTQAPVAKAFLQSTDASPFAIYGGYVLAVTVGGVTTQHAFQTSDFQAPGAATAYEICASINADTLVNFEATTAGGGTYVVIRAIKEANESIQVTVPSSPNLVNANLYMGFPTTLNETLRLYRDGVLLLEDGNTASVFSEQQGSWSSSISNGDTLIIGVDGTAQNTYTFLNADFIATGLYNTVNATNSLASWALVINNKVTGITATVSGSQLELTSNLGANPRAQIVINPSSTLVTKSMFSVSEGLTSQGAAAGYTLDRNTAQFELATPLVEGEDLEAGIESTRAVITSAVISGASITFPSEGYIWIAIDEPATTIHTGVTAGSFLTVSVSGSLVSYKSNTLFAFSDVVPGDYVIIWSAELNAANRLEGRVHSITTTTLTNDTLNILVTSAEAAAVVPQANVIYKAGFVVANMKDAPQKFNTPTGLQTLDALVLFLQAQTDSLIFGVIVEEYLTITSKTLNTNGYVTVVTFDAIGQDLNFSAGQSSESSYPIIAYQDTVSNYLPSFFHSKVASDTYAEPPDTFLTSFVSDITLAGRDDDEIITFLNPYGGIDDEQPVNEVVQETTVSGTTVGITKDPDVRRIRTNDRFFTSAPLSFGNKDSLVAIIDNNPVNNTFQIPLYRHALTNTSYSPNSNNFNAYDTDLAPTGSFVTSFGANFAFNNYKVLMQAKKTLSSTTPQSSILYRATAWGATGQEIVVSYVYSPSAPALNNSVTITNTINVAITVPPATTATAVAAYVNANLSAYVSATVVNDGSGGTPGTGIITANASTQLLDGINWLLSSNVSGSPQFVLKNALALPTDVGYAFNNGETLLFVPTTIDQVNLFINTLAVSGISTASLINTANRDSQLEVSSETYGSQGYVEIVGGAANGYSFPVINSGLDIDNTYCAISASSIASANVISGQWFYLQAANTQQKQTQFGPGTDVTITPNQPSAGLSTVSLTGQTLSERFFGAPRIISGLSGLTFRVEAQGDLVCFSYVGSTGSPQYLTFSVNFNESGGGNLSVAVPSTGIGQYTITSGAATFSGLSIGDLVTVSGLTNSANNGTFVVSGVSSSVLQVTNPNAAVEASDTYTTGTFTATTGVMEGDSVIVGAPFSAPNQGTYRVIRTFNDSFWIKNTDYVEEEQVLTGSSLKFYEYEATIPGDDLVISSNAFGTTNAGTYPVYSVPSPTEIVVTGVLTTTYVFSVSSANATVGATYSNNGGVFTVGSTISGGTTLLATGTSNPLSSGTLTKISGTGDTTITFSSYTINSINLNGLLSSFYIEEGTAYTGYKHVYLVALQPGTTNLNQILFDTYLQYEKINQSAGVEVTALNKLNFGTSVSQGLDGYKYNTGLIQQANRVIYGDPTDSSEYPGISAAGADIFIREPLALVVSLAIGVRLQTGAPFSAVSQQIQSNVAALVNSNKVGQSIALGSIVAVCMVVPGVTSVVISSPLYSPTDDLIAVQQSEQTFILDPSNVSVSVIGS